MSVAMQQKEEEYPMQEKELIYALDIGTRSVIGMLGRQENGRVHILAVEKQPHERRWTVRSRTLIRWPRR